MTRTPDLAHYAAHYPQPVDRSFFFHALASGLSLATFCVGLFLALCAI